MNTSVRATAVRFDDAQMWVDLEDGRTQILTSLRFKPTGRVLKLLLLMFVFIAADRPAKAYFPRRKGECGWVHGKYLIANGSSVRRIFIAGTKHAVALHDDDENIPAVINSYYRDPAKLISYITGDFRVCASEGYINGHLQHVSLNGVRRLVNENGNPL